MAQIEVLILDPEGSPRGVELPDNVPMRAMLPPLAQALGHGEGCELYNRTQHFWYESVDTLAIRNTREGDTLRLMKRKDDE